MELALKLFTFDPEDENIGWITANLNSIHLHFISFGIIPNRLLPLLICFVAKKGITEKANNEAFIKESEFNKNKNCVSKGKGNTRRNIRCSTKLCIVCLPGNSKLGLGNVEMIARNVGECRLLQVSTHTVTVYKDSATFPDVKFLRKLKCEQQDFHEKCRDRDGILIYKDTDGTLYSVVQDCIFSQKFNEIVCDTNCSIWFDIIENKFIETDSHDEKPANKSPKQAIYKQNLHDNNMKYLMNRKKRCHCVSQSRPISLNTTNKKEKPVDKTAPFFETSYNMTPYDNDRHHETIIAQASDESAERTVCPSSFPNSLTTDNLRGVSSRQPNIFSPIRNGRRYSNTAYTNFINVEARRISFTRAWPHSSEVQSIENMVQGGFFFTGNGDLIRCYQCGIGLKDWGQTDDPLTEHVRYSPDCQYIIDAIPPTTLREKKASFLPNNVVSTRESTRTDSAAEATNTVAEAGYTNEQVILPVQPRNPQYVEINVRISSFSKWPRDITQTPEELAEAGFFYTGCNDIVRCFTCDGGLQKWSPGDSAWVEHARWFPHCSYVRVKKGEDFVELVRLSAEQEETEEQEATEQGAGGYTAAFDEAAIGGMEHLSISDKTEDTHSFDDIKKNVCAVLECSEEKVTRAVKDMKLRGLQITQESVVNYVLECILNEPNHQSDSLINFQKEPKSVEELLDETEKLRNVIKCHKCGENDVNCLFLPCAHHCFCIACSNDILICPMCQQKIKNKVKTFMS